MGQDEIISGRGLDGGLGRVEASRRARELFASADERFSTKHFGSDKRGTGSSDFYRQGLALLGVDPEDLKYFGARRFSPGEYTGRVTQNTDDYRAYLNDIVGAVDAEDRGDCAHALGRYAMGLYRGRRFFQGLSCMELACLMDPGNTFNHLRLGDMVRRPTLGKGERMPESGNERNYLLGYESASWGLSSVGLAPGQISGGEPVENVSAQTTVNGVWSGNNLGYFAYSRGRFENHTRNDPDSARFWFSQAETGYLTSLTLLGYPRDLTRVGETSLDDALTRIASMASDPENLDAGRRVEGLTVALNGIGNINQYIARELGDMSGTGIALHAYQLCLQVQPDNKQARDQVRNLLEVDPDAPGKLDAVLNAAPEPGGVASGPVADAPNFLKAREGYNEVDVSDIVVQGLVDVDLTGFDEADVEREATEMVRDLMALREHPETADNYTRDFEEMVYAYWDYDDVSEMMPTIARDWTIERTVRDASSLFRRRDIERAGTVDEAYETIVGQLCSESVRPHAEGEDYALNQETPGDRLMNAFKAISDRVIGQ